MDPDWIGGLSPGGCRMGRGVWYNTLYMWAGRIRKVLTGAVVLFVLLQILSFFVLDALMFHPVKGGYDESAEGFVNLGREGEPRIAAVVLGLEHGRKVVLRCHGNAEDMYHTLGRLRPAAGDLFALAAVDYPGYGLSDGRPTEDGCYRNVHRLYEYLVKERGVDPEDILVDGFSIGTGPALELATSEPVGGLVLEAPFYSAPRSVTRARILIQDPFPNAKRFRILARDGWVPLLIIHGTDDRVIPFAQGRGLYDYISGYREYPRSRFIPVPGADHNDIVDVLGIDDYREALQWLSRESDRQGGLVHNGNFGDYPSGWWILVLPGLLILIDLYRRLAARERRERQLAELKGELDGKTVRHRKNAKPGELRHHEPRTMTLGQNKLMKTGSPEEAKRFVREGKGLT